VSILGNLISLQFAIGFVSGFVLSRLWCVYKAVREDKRNPLPDGRHRSKWSAMSIDARALAIPLGVTFLAWSVFQTQANATDNARIAADAKTFAEQVQRCQAELISSIVGSRRISSDNDRLSQAERDLLAEGSRLGQEWIGSLLLPPPDIARLTANDPVRQQYNIDRTRIYFDRAGEINRGLDAIHTEQQRNERSRPPLPDPRCGT
jgi:hypothetical protein